MRTGYPSKNNFKVAEALQDNTDIIVMCSAAGYKLDAKC